MEQYPSGVWLGKVRATPGHQEAEGRGSALIGKAPKGNASVGGLSAGAPLGQLCQALWPLYLPGFCPAHLRSLVSSQACWVLGPQVPRAGVGRGLCCSAVRPGPWVCLGPQEEWVITCLALWHCRGAPLPEKENETPRHGAGRVHQRGAGPGLWGIVHFAGRGDQQLSCPEVVSTRGRCTMRGEGGDLLVPVPATCHWMSRPGWY